MFVQTFATVRSCIPPFLTCCLFEPNCAQNFKAQRGARGASGKGPKKGAKKVVRYLESDELGSTKGPATGPLHASHGGGHATEGREGASSKPWQR